MTLTKLPPSPPPVFTQNKDYITSRVEKLIDDARKAHEEILSNITPESATFNNVLIPLAHIHNSLTCEIPILCFYQSISTDVDIRDASTKAKDQYADFGIETKMHEGLFALINAVVEKHEDLDTEDRRLLERYHRDYIRHGLGLDTQQRQELEKVQKRLVRQINEFEKNLREESDGAWFTADDLIGLPEDMIAGLEHGTDVNEGQLQLTFSFPHRFTTLKYAKNSETRRQYYIAHENRCPDNVAIFKEIMVLRQEAAQLLGYDNHASFRVEDKMAKTPEAVMAFLDDLRSRLSAGAQDDIKRLSQFKNADLAARGQPAETKFYLWDYAYYNQQLLETQYSVDRQELAEYFPLDTTVKGVMNVFQHLFGLVFEEIVAEKRDRLSPTGMGEDLIWQEDVQFFAVWNDQQEEGEFLGYLYLDLHARAGKYGGMCNINLQGGFQREDGSRQHPATALICNFTRPTTDKPSLLNHEEVQLFFHELGHAIHDLVAKTKFSLFHGTATVDDFCEAPSQMLEYWCWVPSLLQSLSHHYSYLSPAYLKTWRAQNGGEERPQPPRQLPIETINRLVESKNVNGSLYQTRLLHRAYFDMKVHQSPSIEFIKSLDIAAEWNRLQTEISYLDGPESSDWGHGHTNFDALMHAYDAGFYGYLYSRVYATDMFYSIFKDDPLNSSEGRRYRHTIIGKGASKDEMETLVEFLGREPSTEAFYKELGLS